MDEEVEAAPAVAEGGEGRVERGLVGDVTGHHDLGADRGGERLHPLAERLALVREGELRAGVVERLAGRGRGLAGMQLGLTPTSR